MKTIDCRCESRAMRAGRDYVGEGERGSGRSVSIVLAVLALLTACSSIAEADPCGMVPPVYVGGNVPIARVGAQRTYVFYKDGVETFVIRPGFEGKVEEFGMLIPFPTVPALRKVSDNIFPHIAAAVDPPEVVIDLRFRALARAAKAGGAPLEQQNRNGRGLMLERDKVRVLKEEAVGMYEVAVLEAGSAAALKKWMDDHGFVYPKGMDKACNDYVDLGWCFVAVKTRVGRKAGVDPKPGLRQVDPKLPDGATFDGHVQAMGFRFKVDKLVVPMRLSAFNKGELHNVVYLLSEEPQKIDSIPAEYVVRQVPGEQLFKNVTDPLPLRLIGGTVKDLQQWQKQNLKERRNPVPHNGAARDLFAADLLAVKEGRLTHPHEETEKMFLNIGERLGLRGPEIDKLNEQALAEQREQTVKQALAEIKGMTLTVIDGNFPRKLLAERNLTFSKYRMPTRRNSPRFYDAKQMGPAPEQQGVIHYGAVSLREPERGESTVADNAAPNPATEQGGLWPSNSRLWGLLAVGSCLVIGVFLRTREKRGFKKTGFLVLLAGGLALYGLGMLSQAAGQEKAAEKEPTNLQLIDQLGDPKRAPAAADALIARGRSAVPDLLGEALEGNSLVLRGWAIVCLAEIGGDDVQKRLIEMHQDKKQPMLVRTWAAAGRVQMASTTDELLKLAELIPQFPALGRPIGLKLIAELNRKGEDVSAEQLLAITLKVPQLQQSLTPAILALGVAPLVEAMATANDQNVRRQAAAYLGTLANQGEDAVPAAVIEAYKFDPKAADVPWKGGPLFIPALQWKKKDAQALVGHLVAWYLWCERNNKKQHQRAIHNNLRSIQLAAAAGYQSPGFQQVGTDRWLLIWGQAVGKRRLQKLLDEQGVGNDPRYRRIVDRL